MEEEIDLRPYIELLIRRWYIIVGAAVLAGLVAFGVTSLQDPVYEATALVAVTRDRLIAQFDPRFDTSDEPQPIKALPELAVSDDVFNEVLINLDPPLENVDSINDLSGLVEANAGSDPSLIQLTATHSNPAEAARIANLWAEIFVGTANDIFGDGDGEQLNFFEDQLSQADEELSSVEADLIEFQGVNRSSILGNQVNDMRELHNTHLADRRSLNKLEANIKDLRDQIAESDVGTLPSFADQLTALILQLRVFNATSALPLQLQFDGTSDFSLASLDEQVAILDDLQETVMSRLVTIEAELTELEPELLSLQEALQEANSQQARYVLNRDVAQETYRSLARKLDEERITSDDMTRGIRLASEAAVPVEPESRGRVMAAALAATIMAFVIVIVFVSFHWWNSES